MWLRAAGLGVFVYDQRASGRSTGKLPGVDPERVGLLGWS